MRRIYRPHRAALGLLGVIALVSLLLTPQDAHARITATQSIEVEYRADVGEWAAFGTLIVDLAAGPGWHLTYIHEREWRILGRWQRHDISVTRYLADTRSVTFGWRRKVPENPDGRLEDAWYGILAWQWGK